MTTWKKAMWWLPPIQWSYLQLFKQRGGNIKDLLETLLGAGGRAIWLGQGNDAVRVLQMWLQGLLVRRLQGVVQMLCLSAEVTVETPVTPGSKAQYVNISLLCFRGQWSTGTALFTTGISVLISPVISTTYCPYETRKTYRFLQPIVLL